jgi:hypothetical protein
VPLWPFKVVVAMTVERSDAVPYAKPFWVASAPPVAVIEAFRVSVEVETGVGGEVVTVGATIHALVVVFASALYPVPPEFVA